MRVAALMSAQIPTVEKMSPMMAPEDPSRVVISMEWRQSVSSVVRVLGRWV